MSLAGQGEEVGNDLRAEREQFGLDLSPTVRSGLVKVKLEHDPQAARQALSFLFEQVWLGVPNKARLPQQSSLLVVCIEVPCKSVSLDQTVEESGEVVEGERAVHPPVSSLRLSLPSVEVVVLSPG